MHFAYTSYGLLCFKFSFHTFLSTIYTYLNDAFLFDQENGDKGNMNEVMCLGDTMASFCGIQSILQFPTLYPSPRYSLLLRNHNQIGVVDIRLNRLSHICGYILISAVVYSSECMCSGSVG